MGGLATHRGVDHQLDKPGANGVLDIGAPLMHLEDRLHAQTGLAQRRGRALGGYQLEAQLGQSPGHRQQRGLVAIMGGEEHPTCGGQGFPGSLLSLGIGIAKAFCRAHHFTGGAHFRSQQRVGAREALEGQHRFLHRLQGGDRF